LDVNERPVLPLFARFIRENSAVGSDVLLLDSSVSAPADPYVAVQGQCTLLFVLSTCFKLFECCRLLRVIALGSVDYVRSP
jgi:hypothetical protein